MAEAKKQIKRISDVFKKVCEEGTPPFILIGGLAVNQYVVTRESEDIDILCPSHIATEIIRKLYPNNTWGITNETEDDYRPAYVIHHKTNKKYPVIRFGPKITERGLYDHICEDDLRDNPNVYSLNNVACSNIIVPSLECLCYIKVVAFIDRDENKVDKLKQDLQDIIDLSNDNNFRLGVFLNLIEKNNMQEEIKEKFHKRLELTESTLNNSNLATMAGLFYNSLSAEATQNCQSAEVNQDSVVSDDKKQPVQRDRLIAFDLDGTLIKGIRHSWTILWDEVNADRKVQDENKEQFQNGNMSYLEWAKRDCERFKELGLTRSHVTSAVKKSCKLTKNLKKAIMRLKEAGFVTAIISGGVDAVLYTILPDAKDLFDEILINKFHFDENGSLISISPTEYDWDDEKRGVVGKNRGLERLCEKYSVPLENAIFVGDDMNDIKAMEISGLKIYYCTDDRTLTQQLPKNVILIPRNDLMQVVNAVMNYFHR